jgi:glycosyltransferase involved in cell wall biosynthesis
MRILQVGPVPPHIGGTTAGGVASHLWALATHLHQKGHSVGVLADNVEFAERQVECANGSLTVHGARPLARGVAGLGLLQRPGFWNRIIRTKNHLGSFQTWRSTIGNLLAYEYVITRFQPELIHVHHLEHRFPFAFFASCGQVPIITTIHSLSFDLLQPELKELVRRNLRLAQGLIYVSNTVRQKFEKLFPDDVVQQQVFTILNPVDCSLYYPLKKRNAIKALGKRLDVPVILFVGRLTPLKGAELLIEAAAVLRDRGLKFRVYIVGDGPEKQALESLSRQHNLVQQVVFEGHRDYPDLLYYYNLAQVLALPSQSEGFSITLLEAMACGCPVIGTTESTIEAISPGRVGFRCEATIASVACCLEKALSTEWDRQHIVKHAAAFSWQSAILQFEAAYNQVRQ